jgi:hypothetical protein
MALICDAAHHHVPYCQHRIACCPPLPPPPVTLSHSSAALARRMRLQGPARQLQVTEISSKLELTWHSRTETCVQCSMPTAWERNLPACWEVWRCTCTAWVQTQLQVAALAGCGCPLRALVVQVSSWLAECLTVGGWRLGAPGHAAGFPATGGSYYADHVQTESAATTKDQ